LELLGSLQEDPVALLGERGIVLIDADFSDREGIFRSCPTVPGDVFDIVSDICRISWA
jgi:hypothetical protein